MPRYSYRCPECMYAFERTLSIADRDQEIWCLRCSFSDLIVVCGRIPTSASFTVDGFNAKNGYSK